MTPIRRRRRRARTTANITTADASNISQTGATLSGFYDDVTGTLQTAGFRYGTSASSLNSTISGSFSGGSISASLTELNPGTTYYCQAYATVCGTGDKSSSTATFYGEVKSFTTETASPVKPAVDKDWLELPAGVDDNSGRYVVNTTYDSERNYTVCYDTQMMTPLWTAYPLNSGHMGSLTRPGSWSYNPDIPQQYQANLISHSYSNSAYARGHMCPNGSRNGNSTMQKQTFYVTNQVPQIQKLNPIVTIFGDGVRVSHATFLASA